jgi:hypothetical protein
VCGNRISRKRLMTACLKAMCDMKFVRNEMAEAAPVAPILAVVS